VVLVVRCVGLMCSIDAHPEGGQAALQSTQAQAPDLDLETRPDFIVAKITGSIVQL
jgi:hypothetical protein